MSETKKVSDCIIGNCQDGRGPWCHKCGFHQKEFERRKELPLVGGPDGVYRKYVGVKDAETE